MIRRRKSYIGGITSRGLLLWRDIKGILALKEQHNNDNNNDSNSNHKK